MHLDGDDISVLSVARPLDLREVPFAQHLFDLVDLLHLSVGLCYRLGGGVRFELLRSSSSLLSLQVLEGPGAVS